MFPNSVSKTEKQETAPGVAGAEWRQGVSEKRWERLAAVIQVGLLWPLSCRATALRVTEHPSNHRPHV